VPSPAQRIIAFMEMSSLPHFLEFDVAQSDFYSGTATKPFGKLFRKINGAVLAAGTAERDHEILEAASAIGGNAGVDERKRTCEKLVHGFLLIEVVDYRSIFSGERFEAFFPAGIGEVATVENETATIAGIVLGQTLVKRKTENANKEIVGVSSDGLKFFRGQHAFECAHERRKLNGQFGVVK